MIPRRVRQVARQLREIEQPGTNVPAGLFRFGKPPTDFDCLAGNLPVK
jgi:hypothetical protein